jgi:hypothetical protein
MNFKTRLWLSGAFVRAALLLDWLIVKSYRLANAAAPRQAAPFMDLWLLALKAFRRSLLVPFVGFVGGLIWGKLE